MELAPSTGSVYRGTLKDYSTHLTVYIAYRKPAEIGIVALVPLVRTTLFSMVSDGKAFRVYLPTQNKFIEGANDAPAASSKKFENARPQDFLAAMLVRPVEPHEPTTRPVTIAFPLTDNIRTKSGIFVALDRQRLLRRASMAMPSACRRKRP